LIRGTRPLSHTAPTRVRFSRGATLGPHLMLVRPAAVLTRSPAPRECPRRAHARVCDASGRGRRLAACRNRPWGARLGGWVQRRALTGRDNAMSWFLRLSIGG